jgi:hypothetical protein
MLLAVPVAFVALTILDSVDASRWVARGVMTLVVIGLVLFAAFLEERHGSFLRPR